MSSSGYSIIQTTTFILSGDNTKRWCNGMFSNNFRSMQPLQCHRSAICDDRGRVQGFLDAICTSENTFLCALDGIEHSDFSKRFQMYMILDDIESDECSGTLIHVFGERAEDTLSTLGLPTPDTAMAVQHDDLWIQSRSRLRGHKGFDILSSSEDDTALKAIQDKLHVLQPETTANEFEDLRIQTGTPRYPQDFTDKSFIHDYDLQDEVCSFNKGCYVGQEIINRMDIKKLATKKLLRLTLTGDWSVGEDVSLNDKKAGTITSIDSTGTIGLALLRKNAWEAGTTLKNGDNIAVVD